jgi:hypothetical protein
VARTGIEALVRRQTAQIAEHRDAAIDYTDITYATRCASAVDQRAVFDNEIYHCFMASDVRWAQ